MTETRSKVDRLLRQASACLEIAERMSLRDDRIAMIEQAQRWLERAHEELRPKKS